MNARLRSKMAKSEGECVAEGEKSQQELDNEVKIEIARINTRAEGITTVCRDIVKWAGMVGVAYYCYSSIEALAGEHTVADIAVGFLANVEISVMVSWVVAVGSIIYGRRQKKLRMDTIERLQGRVQTLEADVDPERESSKLTERGESRPEDTI